MSAVHLQFTAQFLFVCCYFFIHQFFFFCIWLSLWPAWHLIKVGTGQSLRNVCMRLAQSLFSLSALEMLHYTLVYSTAVWSLTFFFFFDFYTHSWKQTRMNTLKTHLCNFIIILHTYFTLEWDIWGEINIWNMLKFKEMNWTTNPNFVKFVYNHSYIM